MTLSPLAKLLLGLAIAHTPIGGSLYSMQAMPECGTDAENPTCPLVPVCEQDSVMCVAPRWSVARAAWVRVETKAAAVHRYERIAYALASAARYSIECTDDTGSVDLNCTRVNWPRPTADFAKAELTMAIWESGLREDIEGAYPPVGRGTSGEVCLMEVMPVFVPQYAAWLTPKERAAASATNAAREALALTLVGDNVDALRKCFLVGGQMLSRARAHAATSCRGYAWSYSMFAIYGTGSKCDTKTNAFGNFAAKRQRTYETFRKIGDSPLPEWARIELGYPAALTPTEDAEP